MNTVREIGIREFARRLGCAPSYICKLVDNGKIRKTANGGIDPIEAVEDMRRSISSSRFNLSGICIECGAEQDYSEIGGRACQCCRDKNKKQMKELEILLAPEIERLSSS